jgi:hypothetical protein
MKNMEKKQAVTEQQRPAKGRLRTNATRYRAQKNPQLTPTVGWL